MRGAAMSLTAAASGFVVFLLSVSVVQGQNRWGVTYTSTQICASKGSTVDINCTYRYPSIIKGTSTVVKKTFWFNKGSNYEPVDLKTDSEYSGRVQYHCDKKDCSLRITDLRQSDSAEYKFKFITNHPGGKYFGSPGVTLTVTDFQVHVRKSSSNQHPTWTELTCHSNCQLLVDPSYIWYKNGQPTEGKDIYFHPDPINPEDEYSCALSGYESFPSPSVYPPKLPSMSVSPSDDIIEGSSVTLTCSIDANPAANYTWYKKNVNPDLQPLSKEPQLVFSSIQSSDSGEYYCTAENQLGKRTSEYIFIDVKYAPKSSSVSVSPSGQIVEGSSVTLTCSSDANPAANYTWYKENEDSPKASGQIFTITDVRPEHSGNYYCEAQNKRGRHYSTLNLTVGSGKSVFIMNIIRVILVVLMLIPLLLLSLWMRKKKTLSSNTELNEPVETIELDSSPVYEDVSDLQVVAAAQTEDTEEQEDVE